MVYGVSEKSIFTWHLAQSPAISASTESMQYKTITALDTTPDGQLLVAGTEDGGLCVWDIQTGTMLRQLPRVHQNGAVTAVKVSGNGLVATGDAAGVVTITPLSALISASAIASYTPDAPSRQTIASVTHSAGSDRVVGLHWMSETAVVAAFHGGPVHALGVTAATRSTPLLTFNVGGVTSSTMTPANVLYIGTDAGAIYSVHPTRPDDHRLVSTVEGTGPVLGLSATLDGCHLVGHRGSTVFMVDSITGMVRTMGCSGDRGDPITVAPVAPTPTDLQYTTADPVAKKGIILRSRPVAPAAAPSDPFILGRVRIPGYSVTDELYTPEPPATPEAVEGLLGPGLEDLDVDTLASVTAALFTDEDVHALFRDPIHRAALLTAWLGYIETDVHRLLPLLDLPGAAGLLKKWAKKLAEKTVALMVDEEADIDTDDAIDLLVRLPASRGATMADCLESVVGALIRSSSAQSAVIDYLTTNDPMDDWPALTWLDGGVGGRAWAVAMPLSDRTARLPLRMMAALLSRPLPTPIVAGRLAVLPGVEVPVKEILDVVKKTLDTSWTAADPVLQADLRQDALIVLRTLAHQQALVPYAEPVVQMLVDHSTTRLLACDDAGRATTVIYCDTIVHLFRDPRLNPLLLTTAVEEGLTLLTMLVSVLAGLLGLAAPVSDVYTITPSAAPFDDVPTLMAVSDALRSLLDVGAAHLYPSPVFTALITGILGRALAFSKRYHAALDNCRMALPQINTACFGVAKGRKNRQGQLPDKMTTRALSQIAEHPALALSLARAAFSLLRMNPMGVAMLHGLLAELVHVPAIAGQAMDLQRAVGDMTCRVEATARSGADVVPVPVMVPVTIKYGTDEVEEDSKMEVTKNVVSEEEKKTEPVPEAKPVEPEMPAPGTRPAPVVTAEKRETEEEEEEDSDDEIEFM